MTHKQNQFVRCNVQQDAHSIHYIRHIFPLGKQGRASCPALTWTSITDARLRLAKTTNKQTKKPSSLSELRRFKYDDVQTG